LVKAVAVEAYVSGLSLECVRSSWRRWNIVWARSLLGDGF